MIAIFLTFFTVSYADGTPTQAADFERSSSAVPDEARQRELAPYVETSSPFRGGSRNLLRL